MLGNGKRAPSSLCVTLQPTQLPVYHQNTSTRGYDQGVSCWSEYLAISAQLGAPDRHWRGVSSPDDVPECSVGSNPSGTSTLSSQGVVHPFDERSCTGIHLVLKEIQLRALEMVMCGRRRLVLRIGQPFNSTVPSPRVKRITCQLSPTHAKARSYTKGKTFEEACKGRALHCTMAFRQLAATAAQRTGLSWASPTACQTGSNVATAFRSIFARGFATGEFTAFILIEHASIACNTPKAVLHVSSYPDTHGLTHRRLKNAFCLVRAWLLCEKDTISAGMYC